MTSKQNVEQPENPREKANIFSISFFWWMNPILFKGYKKDLELEDIYKVRDCDESKKLGDDLEREWDKEIKKAHEQNVKGEKYSPSLFKALVRVFGWRYASFGIFVFLEECGIRILQPIFMGWMMLYFVPESEVTSTEAYLFAGGVVLMSAAYTFTHHAYFFGLMHTGMRMRIACSTLLYRKALKLSNSSLGQTTVGQMVNLLSNDVNRFDSGVLFFHYLWGGPLQLVIITALLWYRMGPSSLTGAALLIMMVPLQTWVGKKIGKLRVSTASKTDKRIRLMNEIVNGMKVIKMYTWEQPFSKIVEDARKEEVGVIRHTNYFRSFNFSFFFTASRVVLLCTFLVYGLTGEPLSAEIAFLCLSLYNIVRLSMTLFFPFAITLGGEVSVSISRIRRFLMLEEKDATNSARTFHPQNNQIALKCSRMSAKWSSEELENTLSDISLTIKPGQLIAIIGPVGSGKSSVIQAILGELPLSVGEVDVYGDISYASQEPWMFSGSVEENILFGKNMDRKRYNKVVEACALDTDFSQWPYGDKTLVGERGVSLSGGQKARVALARAIYRTADCYLLDDPLSAVDAHVGSHLFENCIRGYLKKSAVILVTHQLQFLQQADLIIVLKNGKVQEMGDFNYLVQNGLDFSAFLAAEVAEDEDDIEQNAVVEEPVQPDLTVPRRHSLVPNGHRASIVSLEDMAIIEQLRRKSRSMSITSEMSHMSGIREDVNRLDDNPEVEVTKETVKTGSINFKLYLSYFKSGGNCFTVLLLIFFNLLTQGLYSGSDVWLTYWTDNIEKEMLEQPLPHPVTVTTAANASEVIFNRITNEEILDDHYFYLGIYAAIVGTLIVFSMARTMFFFVSCLKASKRLHNAMFQKIVRVPCRFFDTNPVGRILNRFSKDMGAMDELLPPAFFDALTIFLNILGILTVVISVTPWIVLPTLVLAVIFYFLRKFYMSTARDIKRLEGAARSPVFSQLSLSLDGLTTIRAFSAQEMLMREFDRIHNIHSSTWFGFISATRWFGVWLDWIVVLFLACVVYSFLLLDLDADGGDVGLAISSCITLTGMLQWGTRQSAEVETLMTSVERVMEYGELAEEAPAKSPDNPAPPQWPSDGVVEFNDVCLQYDKDDKFVLKGLNFKTKKHEKIGIVGRTGAGKSSLVAALFRLAEPEGSIMIDNVEALKLGLEDLRSNISIIPQDPILFTGSLRRNLDPFNKYSDEEIWRVLKEVHLSDAVSELRNGLESEMSEGGSNMSMGQRQLICLARAVLMQNSILVLDEATANVDPKTDQLIQEQIRLRFNRCTVLTIAHRLHTIMDSDRILVLSDGKVVEFDTPHNLLSNPKGVFSELVDQTGEATRQKLKEIAANKQAKDDAEPNN